MYEENQQNRKKHILENALYSKNPLINSFSRILYPFISFTPNLGNPFQPKLILVQVSMHQ